MESSPTDDAHLVVVVRVSEEFIGDGSTSSWKPCEEPQKEGLGQDSLDGVQLVATLFEIRARVEEEKVLVRLQPITLLTH